MSRRTRLLIIGIPLALGLLAPGVAFAHGSDLPAPTFPGVLGRWEFDPYVVAGLVVYVWLYAAGVMRVNRLHPNSPVPRKRVVCFAIGILAIVAALVSPVGAYDDTLFSFHMVQHILLMEVAAPFILLGAPVTLALRAATPEIRKRFLLPILHSRVVRAIAFPPVAWFVFAGVLWGSHYSGVYDAALTNDWLHRCEHLAMFLAGLLFWWQAIGVDPSPWRMPHPMRLIYVALLMPQMAWLGLSFYGTDHVLYSHYADLTRTWGPSPLSDQQSAGLIMWLVSDTLSGFWTGFMIYRWVKHEELATQRKDRELDREKAARIAAAG